jgi:acyl-CoA thioester hydrolase
MSLFKHKTPIEIRFADVDAFGHVNNAKFLTYVEMARVRYFDEIVEWGYDWSKEGIILARAEIDFIQPILFKDELTVFTRCSRIGRKSFDLEYQLSVIRDGKEILKADACTVMVAFDYQRHQSIEVPASWREAILAYEGENVMQQ